MGGGEIRMRANGKCHAFAHTALAKYGLHSALSAPFMPASRRLPEGRQTIQESRHRVCAKVCRRRRSLMAAFPRRPEPCCRLNSVLTASELAQTTRFEQAEIGNQCAMISFCQIQQQQHRHRQRQCSDNNHGQQARASQQSEAA